MTTTTATAKAVREFDLKIDRIASSAKAAVEAVWLTSTGGRNATDAAWSDDLESVKRLWPGAILRLSDGDGGTTRFAYVPLKGSVKASERNGIQLKISYTGAETGGEFWDSAKVKSDVKGIWPVASLAQAGTPVTIGSLRVGLSPSVSAGGLHSLIVKIAGDEQVKSIGDVADAAQQPVSQWRSVDGSPAIPPTQSVRVGPGQDFMNSA